MKSVKSTKSKSNVSRSRVSVSRKWLRDLGKFLEIVPILIEIEAEEAKAREAAEAELERLRNAIGTFQGVLGKRK